MVHYMLSTNIQLLTQFYYYCVLLLQVLLKVKGEILSLFVSTALMLIES